MAILLNTGRWKQNPTQPLAVDWDHPLSQGLLELGYIAAGRPYSAIQRAQPYLTGLGTPTPTAQGGAMAVSGTGNYIHLGRNVSAATVVASTFIRGVFPLSVGTPAFTSSLQAGSTAYTGHRADVDTAGAIYYLFGANNGTSWTGYRQAVTTSGVVQSNVPVSLVCVCRGSSDFSFYRDGVYFPTVQYWGTATSYSPGTAAGTLNFAAAWIPTYGNYTPASWAHWGIALTRDDALWLQDNPFAMLVKPRRRP